MAKPNPLEGQHLVVIEPSVRVYGSKKDAHAPLYGKIGTELLYGETMQCVTQQGNWIEIINDIDGYQGWVDADAVLPFHPDDASELFFVITPHTQCYAEPNIKARDIMPLSFMSRLMCHPQQRENGFIAMENGQGWVPERAVVPVSEIHTAQSKKDLCLASAVQFLNTPYVYGGRSGWGLDCSALVQLTLARVGISISRDTGPMKEHFADKAVDKNNLAAGDIVFFPGHVGMMISDKDIIHAFGHTMQVQVDNIDTINAFYEEREKQGITTCIRLF